MAYSQTAFRYALHGIPDPSLGLDDPQAHYGFQGIAQGQPGIDGRITATLGGVTADFDGTYTAPPAVSWDLSDRLSMHLIPSPVDGLDNEQVHHTIGGVPFVIAGVTAIEGAMSPTLGSIVVDFDGTHTAPVTAGLITATLGSPAVSFVGENVYIQFFDIEYSLTPTWVTHEIPANFGDIVATLGGLTASLSGFSLPPDSTQGRIETTAGGLSAALAGAFTVAPGRDGDIGASLASISVGFQGSFVPAGGFLGLIDAALGSVALDFAGTAEPWQTDGRSALSLDGLSITFDGQFIDAGARIGLIVSTVGNPTMALTGTYLTSAEADCTAVFESQDMVIAVFEASSEVTWRAL